MDGNCFFCLNKKAYRDYIFKMELEGMKLSAKKAGPDKFTRLIPVMRLHRSLNDPNPGEEVHDVYFFTLERQPLVLEIKGTAGKADFEQKIQTRIEFELNYSFNKRRKDP